MCRNHYHFMKYWYVSNMAYNHCLNMSKIYSQLKLTIAPSVLKKKSVSQSVSQSASQSVCQSVSQSVSLSAGPSLSQSVSQTVSQSVIHSFIHSFSQSVISYSVCLVYILCFYGTREQSSKIWAGDSKSTQKYPKVPKSTQKYPKFPKSTPSSQK